MATALASQLQALASAQGQSALNRRPITRPTILFDPRQAADVDITTIFSLAISGLEELANLDSRFKAYRKTLFNLENCQIDRELQGREFNAKLDASARAYLCLLSDFLLLTPAHQTLEYLIRRYKIHVYNVDDVIRNILPYHETSVFVRIMQLLQIENTKWHFLEGVKNSGAAPPRALLVQQCLRDMAVLEAICESVQTIAVAGNISRSRTAYSFSVVVVMEVLGAVRTVDSAVVNKILPFIVRSFERGALEEFRVGGLMIIGTLADKTTLSEDIVELFFDLIAKTVHLEVQEVEGDKSVQMCVMVMVQLMQTQALDHFPQKAFKFLVKVRDFPGLLARINKTFTADKFILLLIKSLVKHCVVNSHYGQTLLQLINTLPLRCHAESMVLDLLDLSVDLVTSDGSKSQDAMAEDFKARDIKQLLLAIEKRFPDELDKATSNFLKSHSGNKGNRNGSMLKFLSGVLEGSLHAPMAESNQSIYRSLDHSEAHVRAAAVQHAFVVAENNAEAKLILREALMRRLHDDDLRVVRSVLSLEGLARLVEADDLLRSQVSTLSRCLQYLEKGSRPLKAEAKALGKCCLQFLASDFLDVNPSYVQKVGCIFLSNLLVLSKTLKMNLATLKIVKNLQWGLFEGLSAIQDELPKPDRIVKGSRGSWQYNLNRKIIAALADALMEDSSILPLALTTCAMNHERAKPLIVLILTHCLTSAPKGKMWELVEGFFAFLKQEWLAIDSTMDSTTSKLLEISYTASNRGDIFSVELYEMLEAEPKVAYSKLLLLCLYRLLMAVPTLHMDDIQERRGALSSILEELFVLFSSSQSEGIFKEHVALLLKNISTSVVVFLSRFFISEGGMIPVTAQVHSLNVLASEWAAGLVVSSGLQCNEKAEMQFALPRLLVALANPVKAVRRSASECVKKLYDLWRGNASSLLKNGVQSLQVPLLQSEAFEIFLELILESQTSFVTNGEFLPGFFASSLCPASESTKGDAGSASSRRLNDAARKSILLFILHHALQLPPYAQCTLIVGLKGAGHVVDQALETQELLSSLLSRWKHFKFDENPDRVRKLSQQEVQLLKSLLQTHLQREGVFSLARGGVNGRSAWLDTFLEAVNVGGGQLSDPVMVEPICIALGCLESEMYNKVDVKSQDTIFARLISLSGSNVEAIRTATLLALQKLHVHSMTVVRHIEKLFDLPSVLAQTAAHVQAEQQELINSTARLLEFLVWKTDIGDRHELVVPLFRMLDKFTTLKAATETSEGGTLEVAKNVALKNVESVSSDYVQQLTLAVLESIANLAPNGETIVSIEALFDVDFLVQFIHVTDVVSTRNQALTLLTTLAQLFPDRVLDHVIAVFSVLGETTIIQDDTHSHLVTEQLISAVVPSWLLKMKDPRLLLQIFVKALPQIPIHRRTPLLKNTLRVMQEAASLHVLLLLLLEASLPGSKFWKTSSQKRTRDSKYKVYGEMDFGEWPIDLCGNMCEKYAPSIRLPALVNMLTAARSEFLIAEKQAASGNDQDFEMLWLLQERVTEFVAKQLQKSRLCGELETAENATVFQETFVALVEQVLLLLQMIGKKSPHRINSISKIRKSLHETAGGMLESITNLMAPISFAEGMVHLLKHSDANIKLKVLQLITLRMKANEDPNRNSSGKKKTLGISGGEEIYSQDSIDAYRKMVMEIGEVLAQPGELGSLSIKLEAVSALDASAQRLAEKIPSVFISSLRNLFTNLRSTKASAAASLQCVASIVSALGPLSLPALPDVITEVTRTAKESFTLSRQNGAVDGCHSEDLARVSDLPFAILTALEAVVDKLGSFLNPYLQDILSLLILEPEFHMNTENTLSKKAEAVRSLLPKKIPVRLLLDPLIGIYEKSIQTGEASTLACIKTLSVLVTLLDRVTVSSYYKKLFELCLAAFDLRRRPPKSFMSFTAVETSVVSLLTGLVLKLSESTFKPLFVRILEWAESEVSDEGDGQKWNVDRNIVLYRLVNQLADKLRSVFVPYFQYLLNGCIYHLTNGQDKENIKRRKKTKVTSEITQAKEIKGGLTSSEWHLRQLVISAIHKCFLYDSIGFLDAPKFQLLLGPIVQQIVAEKPFEGNAANKSNEWVPSGQDMDEALIACLGQMAITAGTDLLWKPLNHEVLLCTRSEAVHARVLSLKIVKFLVEHLKEDFLVLLPETIPFLAELLEDPELTVVVKSQEIIKLLEDLSGESLSQYL